MSEFYENTDSQGNTRIFKGVVDKAIILRMSVEPEDASNLFESITIRKRLKTALENVSAVLHKEA